MASIDALYHSDSRPEDLAPDYRCPIKKGDNFGGIIHIGGLAAQSSYLAITAGFYIYCQGHKEWCVGSDFLWAGETEVWIVAISHNMAEWGLPELFDNYGQIGGNFDTRKEAAWGFMTQPGSAAWEANKIASDGDAEVYSNQTPAPPTPDISWIQIISAVAYKR